MKTITCDVGLMAEAFSVPETVVCTLPIPLPSFPPITQLDVPIPHRQPVMCYNMPLSAFDPTVLEMMCDEFRKRVFEAAGKSRPPQELRG